MSGLLLSALALGGGYVLLKAADALDQAVQDFFSPPARPSSTLYRSSFSDSGNDDFDDEFDDDEWDELDDELDDDLEEDWEDPPRRVARLPSISPLRPLRTTPMPDPLAAARRAREELLRRGGAARQMDQHRRWFNGVIAHTRNMHRHR